ncbi:serine/threonine-protein kinase [Candidatus Uabimicrobium amorphum]|uniref:Serine/threonine protein kinase n=1 Tax=Uabimicrobium amorphum TaxID=2596890 RepID=A0A5S9IRT8_UABAM|nr:serine/threonine-protein kinase [Candidatus Uabimicrobium amorphum]BBM86000.1 serine/threonine protein kinase [Candidatus Uabimicrobium amorphum]
MDPTPPPRPSTAKKYDDTIQSIPGIPQQDKTISRGQTFGRYVIEKELGRGGMGIVYKAHDPTLQKNIALKVIMHGDEKYIARFIVESTATAKLNHRNIVRFYEFGEHPQPFFTMEYIEGCTLSTLIKEKQISPALLIDILIEICDALAHAHHEQILHRDIKPSNIMIDHDQKPKIMDFGLAKVFDRTQLDLSKTGDVLGTVFYMAPEQLNGRAVLQSDIYSIGATMYEALTYRTVHQGDSFANLCLQILTKDPIPPRQLNPDICPYFEAICLKCLQRKPEKRYHNFAQLKQELVNLKNNRPIIARKYNYIDKVKNTVRHNWQLFTVIFLIIFLLSAFDIYIWIKDRELSAAYTQLEQQKNHANKTLAKISLQKSADHYKLQKYRDSGVFAAAALDFSQKSGTNVHNIRTQGKLYLQESLRKISLHKYQINTRLNRLNVAMSNDLQTIAFSSKQQVIVANEGKCIFRETYRDTDLISLSLNKSGEVLACSFTNNTVKIYNVLKKTSQTLNVMNCTVKINAPYIVFAYQGLLEIRNLDKPQMIHTTIKTSQEYPHPMLSFHAQKIICENAMYDVNTTKPLAKFSQHQHAIFAGENIIAATQNAIAVFGNDAKKKKQLNGHTATIYTLAFSPRQQIIASGSKDKSVKLWQNNRQIYSLDHFDSEVIQVNFSDEGHKLAVVTRKGSIQYYDLTLLLSISAQTINAHQTPIRHLAFSADDTMIVSAANKNAKLWKNSKRYRTLSFSNRITAITFSHDSKYLAISHSATQPQVTLHNIQTQQQKTFSQKTYDIVSLAFSPDDTKLATVATNGDINIYRALTMKKLTTLFHANGSAQVTFSSDGSLIAAMTNIHSFKTKDTIKIWHIKSGKLRYQFPHKYTQKIAFHPTKPILASIGNGHMYLWNLPQRNKVAQFPHCENQMEFSHQGTTFLTQKDKYTVTYRETKTGIPLRSFINNSQITQSALSNNNDLIATGDTTGKIKIWNLKIATTFFVAKHPHYTFIKTSPEELLQKDFNKTPRQTAQKIFAKKLTDSLSTQPLTK